MSTSKHNSIECVFQ